MALSVPGLMVVDEKLLGRPAGAGDQRRAMICAHEVAHLWFGCLVGQRWWDDVWLDEAIATYLSYAALAAIAGSANRCRGPDSLTRTSRGLIRRTACRAGSRCRLR